MAQMRDSTTSILATEGTEMKNGLLSILRKNRSKMSLSSDYQLNPLYWRLVSSPSQTHLLGYSNHLGGAEATEKLLVKGCSIDINLPEKVVVTPESKETFLCIQCGKKFIFLKAANKHQRDDWVEAIRSAIIDPTYYSWTPARQFQMNRTSLSPTDARTQAWAAQQIKKDDQENRRLHPSPSDQSSDELYATLSSNNDHYLKSSINDLGHESEWNGRSRFFEYNDTTGPVLPERDYQERPVRQMDSIQLTPNGESLHAYTQKFRRELFQEDGFIVEVDTADLAPESIKLVSVGGSICIAALPYAKLHSLLHVDDAIVKVNRQTLDSIDFCYKLFRTSDENKVQLLVKRVVHGILCHVIMSANGDVDSLGLEFGNQSQGNEVTAMHMEGRVAKSGSPSRPRAQGVIDDGRLVNWGLVEINQSPVSFDSSPTDVRDQIKRSGIELALVFIPMDIIKLF